MTLSQADPDTVRVGLDAGDDVVLYRAAGGVPDLVIAPVATEGTWRWGLT